MNQFLFLIIFSLVFTESFCERNSDDDDDDDDNDIDTKRKTIEDIKRKKKQLDTINEKIKNAGLDGSSNLFGQKNGPQHPKMKAFNDNAHKRPTKCQVCRVLMTELSAELNNTDNRKETVWMSNRLDEEGNDVPTKRIDYLKSEMRIMDTLERICQKTQGYKAIAGPEFPYLKGVKSMFRSELEGAMKKSGLALKLDAPEEVLDDPTFEVKRLFAYCNTMIEEYEEEIVDWFLHSREEDPLESVCNKKILKGKDIECLNASTEVPDYATKPLSDDEPSRIKGEL